MASVCVDDSEKSGFDQISKETEYQYEITRDNDYDDYAVYMYGETFLEVMSIAIKNKDEAARLVYGIVQVKRGCGPGTAERMFFQDKNHPVSIKPNSTTPLLLNGPDVCVSAESPFCIMVYIKDKVSGEVIGGYYHFSPDNGPMPEYDKPVIGRFKRNLDKRGKKLPDFTVHDENGFGSLSLDVKFAVFTWAVTAIVEVMLIKYRGAGASANVVGQITARHGCFDDTSSSVLFDKGRSEGLKVSPMGIIQLSRSVLAVPLRSSLIVGADLCDGDDKEIAHGSSIFPTLIRGMVEENICGKYGEIRVKVTWSNSVDR